MSFLAEYTVSRFSAGVLFSSGISFLTTVNFIALKYDHSVSHELKKLWDISEEPSCISYSNSILNYFFKKAIQLLYLHKVISLYLVYLLKAQNILNNVSVNFMSLTVFNHLEILRTFNFIPSHHTFQLYFLTKLVNSILSLHVDIQSQSEYHILRLG